MRYQNISVSFHSKLLKKRWHKHYTYGKRKKTNPFIGTDLLALLPLRVFQLNKCLPVVNLVMPSRTIGQCDETLSANYKQQILEFVGSVWYSIFQMLCFKTNLEMLIKFRKKVTCCTQQYFHCLF